MNNEDKSKLQIISTSITGRVRNTYMFPHMVEGVPNILKQKFVLNPRTMPDLINGETHFFVINI